VSYKDEVPAGVVVHTLQSASDAGIRPEFRGRPIPPGEGEAHQEIFAMGARSILEEVVRSIPAEILQNLRGFQVTVLA
jgi:hypothetical protein